MVCVCAPGEKHLIINTSTATVRFSIHTRGEQNFCSASDLCPTPCCHVSQWKAEPLAQANKALIDIQLNVGTQHMEDLVNTLSFQCWNGLPHRGGWAAVAMEVISG